MRKVLLIINPKSGKMQSKAKLYNIIQPFSKRGDVVSVVITQKRGHATEIAAQAGQYDMVVCVGGDGTLNEVINGVLSADCKTPIGYIPAGSTNDFAATVGFNKNIVKAAQEAAIGGVWTIDIGKMGNRYFSYVASFGMFTRSSYATDQNMKNVFGHLAYMLEGANELGEIRRYDVKITADGEDCSGKYIFGAITNTMSMGGIIKMDKKNVKLDDGLFEMILVREPKNPVELQQTVHAVLTQTYEAPTIKFLTAKQIVVDGGEKFDWSLDGEKFTTKGSTEIVNVHKALGIIVK